MRKAAIVVIVLAFLAVVPSAFAEASRTWVSGVGDDVNPCSRTAPCKTWAGAISKTAAGGEIDALDPAGFGAVTITKAITLVGVGQHASILVSSAPGITINAGVNDVVTLRDLDINGLTSGTNGVRFIAGKALRMTRVSIRGFQKCVTLDGAGAFSLDLVALHGCSTAGVTVNPSSGSAKLVLSRSVLDGNATGVEALAGSKVMIDSTVISNGSGTGISSSASSVVRVTSSTIVYNGTGLATATGGQILSQLNNTLEDNTTDGSFSGSYAAK